MASGFFPTRGERSVPRRHGRRIRTWRRPRSLFRAIRSFHSSDTSAVARIVLSAMVLAAFSVALLLPVSAYAAYAYFARDVPPVEQVLNQPVFQTTQIYDRNGLLLATLIDPSKGRRTIVNLNQLPPDLVNATIAVEDPSFFSNPGVDPLSIVRALAQNLTHQQILSGASTITQQLARNVLFPTLEERQSQTLDRKVRESIFAVRLTQTYDKSQILSMYFNEVFYGNLSYGVGAAAETYFGKPASQLDLAESAMLAGLPQAPSDYDPIHNFPMAKSRQAYVLDRMVVHGYVTQQQADQAKRETLHLVTPQFELKAPHFVNYVTQLIQDRYGRDALFNRGWRIQTTLDYGLDQLARQKAAERIQQIRQKMNANNAAVVTIQPATGEILTMVGSLDYWDKSIDGQVNVAVSPRQPGSSVKAYTYLTAYERGYVPDATVWDVKTTFSRGPGLSLYVPNNFDLQFHDQVMLREAIASSLNIPALKLISRIGVHDMVDTAHALGITTFTDPDRYGITITLGAADAKPLDMAYAYSVFANGGKMVGEPVPIKDRSLGMRQYEPVAILKITDSAGNVIYEYHPAPPIQVVPAQAVHLLTSSLTDDSARHFTFAPRGALVIDRPAAVKTGTTQFEQDAWTVGYTPDLAVAIWVGNTNGTPMNTTISTLSAGAIWHTYMPAAHQYLHLPVRDFQIPPGVAFGMVCGKNDWYIVGIPPICSVG